MRLRVVSILVVVAIGVLAVLAWNRSATRPVASDQGSGSAAVGTGVPADSGGEAMPPGTAPETATPDPGVLWHAPGRWMAELPAGMRLASYAIPSAGTGPPATCVVYYFGPGQGGGVKANIERWIGEFENAGSPTRRSYQVRGLRVSQVDVTGTYRAHAGGAEGEEGGAAGWRLLGAIVEGPQGSLFFKLTGPEATVAAAAQEFSALLASLRTKG